MRHFHVQLAIASLGIIDQIVNGHAGVLAQREDRLIQSHDLHARFVAGGDLVAHIDRLAAAQLRADLALRRGVISLDDHCLAIDAASAASLDLSVGDARK